MKKIQSLLFVLLSLFTLSNKAFFKNATIEDPTIVPNKEYMFIININNYESRLIISETDQNTEKCIELENIKTYNQSNKTLKIYLTCLKTKPKTGTDKDYFWTTRIQFQPDHLIIDRSLSNANFEQKEHFIFDRSIYKAQMLLCQTFIRNKQYEKYIDHIETLIKKFKILSLEPLKFRKKAKTKYSDVKIICQ